MRDPIPDSDPKTSSAPVTQQSIHPIINTQSLEPYVVPLYAFYGAFHVYGASPPRMPGAGLSLAGTERQPVRQDEKGRIDLEARRLKWSRRPPSLDVLDAPPSPVVPDPSSEFDASDMDRYFRSHDDFIPHSTELHPIHDIRRPHTHFLDTHDTPQSHYIILI